MQLAETLGKFEHEILQLSPEELARWMAYFRIVAKEEKKERQKAKARVKSKKR